MKTLWLSDSDFDTVMQSPYDLGSITEQENAVVGFQDFYVVTTDDDFQDGTGQLNKWIGYKAQPWPAAAFTDSYRFESGNKAVGMIYNSGGSSADKWLDDYFELKGAMSGISTVAAATGLAFYAILSF